MEIITSMRERQDLTGQKFGRLLVIAREIDEKGKSIQVCQCDCGETIKIHTYRLKNGHTVSCGCHSRDKAKERMLRVGADLARKHQMSKPLAVKPGDRFGMLTVDSEAPTEKEKSGRRRRAVNVTCDCGNKRTVTVKRLLSGNLRSCGCLKKNMTTRLEHGAWRERSPSAEYRAWQHAKERCYSPMSRDYVNYGGRGITMSDEWKNDFSQFLKDVGERPSRDYSLDRIDVNRGYSKDNCRWATGEEQALNRRVLTIEQKIEREQLKIKTAMRNIKRMEIEAEETARKMETDLLLIIHHA